MSLRFAVIVLVAAAYVGLFAAPPISAAADVTEARYMTQKQFLHSLKQVSLTMHSSGDPLNEYLSADVLAADSEDKLANMSLGDILTGSQKNRKSAHALSGFASNMGLSPGAC